MPAAQRFNQAPAPHHQLAKLGSETNPVPSPQSPVRPDRAARTSPVLAHLALFITVGPNLIRNTEVNLQPELRCDPLDSVGVLGSEFESGLVGPGRSAISGTWPFPAKVAVLT